MILTRDQTFRFVFNIRTPLPQGKESVGTGMFVVKGEKFYMLTATHVAITCNKSTVVVISDMQGNASSISLQSFNKMLNWTHHPIADISFLDVQLNSETQSILINRFLPFDHFDITRAYISRDVELTTVGFPHGLGAQGMFSPLTYRSYASSALISLNRFDTNKPCEFFLLENPSVGGYSGGPVFDLGIMIVGSMTVMKEKTVCAGLIHGTISDETGGKLAAVTPSYYLNGFI